METSAFLYQNQRTSQMSRIKKGIVITKRDEKLFRYLFVNKVATVVDIQKDIFNLICLKTVHRRLMRLSNEKFIEAQAQREYGNRMIYSLSKKGLKEYIADEKSLKRIQLKSDSINHDLAVLSIKRRFKTFKMVNGFYSENLFRSGMMDEIGEIKNLKELRPDAILKIEIAKKTLFLPIEYEASMKYSNRYDKILRKYYLSTYVPAVIFISKFNSIQKKVLQKEANKYSKGGHKFYYITEEDVFSNTTRLKLSNNQKEVLLIS